MVVVEVIAGIVLLVGVLLAFDWFMAGRTKERNLVRAKDQSARDAGVGYAVIETSANAQKHQTGPGI